MLCVLDQMTIAAFDHPAGAGEVAVMYLPGAVRFAVRIYAKYDPHRFRPVRVILMGVVDTEVEFDVAPIIIGEFGTRGCDVVKRLSHDWADHSKLGSVAEAMAYKWPHLRMSR
jgi:hypothetical protein